MRLVALTVAGAAQVAAADKAEVPASRLTRAARERHEAPTWRLDYRQENLGGLGTHIMKHMQNRSLLLDAA